MISDPGDEKAGMPTGTPARCARTDAHTIGECANYHDAHSIGFDTMAPIATIPEDPAEDDSMIAALDLLEDVMRQSGDRILRPSQVRVLITMLLDSKRGAKATIARMREHGEGVGGVGAGIAYNEGSEAAYSYTLAVVSGLLGVAIGELDSIANAHVPPPVDLYAPGLVVTDVDAFIDPAKGE